MFLSLFICPFSYYVQVYHWIVISSSYRNIYLFSQVRLFHAVAGNETTKLSVLIRDAKDQSIITERNIQALAPQIFYWEYLSLNVSSTSQFYVRSKFAVSLFIIKERILLLFCLCSIVPLKQVLCWVIFQGIDSFRLR